MTEKDRDHREEKEATTDLKPAEPEKKKMIRRKPTPLLQNITAVMVEEVEEVEEEETVNPTLEILMMSGKSTRTRSMDQTEETQEAAEETEKEEEVVMDQKMRNPNFHNPSVRAALQTVPEQEKEAVVETVVMARAWNPLEKLDMLMKMEFKDILEEIGLMIVVVVHPMRLGMIMKKKKRNQKTQEQFVTAAREEETETLRIAVLPVSTFPNLLDQRKRKNLLPNAEMVNLETMETVMVTW